MKALIQKLTETFSPSGFESVIREVIRGEVKPLADEIRVDALGNLLVRKGAKAANGLRIMLAAHMDEIGLMATHIDENGFVRFTGVGGIRPAGLAGSRVRFMDGRPGVIGSDRLPDASKLPGLEQCYIDVGASSRADCPVKVGDVCAFERPFVDLGSRLVAKSMDDRIGCVVLVETLRALKKSPHEIYFVFTTQEEVGTRGATTSAFGVDPDLGLAVDVTGTGDTPKSSKMEVALGKGPAIKVKDSGMLSDPRVVAWMARTAEKAHLPYQREVLEGGTTDARAIQLARGGVPAGCLSVPTRYIHSPSEMVDYGDVQNSVKLLTALLSGPVGL
ncbi:MAG TPA: M42 family metallopeptidase [Anaerolineales bacterium]|nr:M42 family metallopeptidase [Anaerolineales bacterium]